MPDDSLITRAREGDDDAWRALYTAHAGRLVVWLGLRAARDAGHSPEDIAAETWYVAASKIHEFRGGADDFAGWLFSIARNLTENARRRHARRRTEPVAPEDLPVPGVVEDDEPQSVLVRSLLSALPPRERDAVGCVDCLGMDIPGTAQALGLSKVAVRVARHRGLARLRREWSGSDHPADADVSSSR